MGERGNTKKNLIIRLLTGDIRLFYTYWVFSLGIAIVFTIANKYIDLNYANLVMHESNRMVLQVFYWVSGLIFVFMYVAIWNSASKYQGPILWKGLAKFIVFIGSLNLVNSYILTSDEDHIRAEVALLQGSLPLMIDSETRLDWLEIDGEDYSYKYTLINFNSEDIDSDIFLEKMTLNIRPDICTNKDMFAILEMGFGIRYDYSGADGVEITQLTIPADTCQ